MVETVLSASKGHRSDANSTRKESISDLKEALRTLRDITDKISVLIHVSQTVKHVNAWHLNLVEHKTSIINAVKANLDAHIFDHDTFAGLHLLITNWYNEGVDTLVLSLDNSLSKDDSVISVAGSISDPELLRQGSG